MRRGVLAGLVGLVGTGCPAVERLDVEEVCAVPDAVQEIFDERCAITT